MTLMPTNLRDAHLHLLPYGASLGQVDLTGAGTVSDALALLGAEAMRRRDPEAARAAPPWIIGYGYRSEAIRERRFPTSAELDAACDAAPCIVNSFDMHAASVSSAVLDAAGIERHTPDPAGGTIGRDPRTGEPTGYLLETARFLLRAAEPKPTRERLAIELRSALDDLSERGFVEAHDMFATADLAELLLDLDARGELAHRVWMYAVPDCIEGVEGVMHRRTGDGRASASGRVVFAGLKLFTDGTLNSRTASMLEPFADPIAEHPRGTPLFDDESLSGHMRWARRRGLGVATHAIGDAAVRQVLNCWEMAGGDDGRSFAPARPIPALRIEHAQFIAPEDLARLAALRVVVSMQPCHLLPDMEALRRLTPHAMGRAFALRALVDAYTERGLDPADFIWLGSDAPVVEPNPADNALAAAHRRRAEMDAREAIAPEQGIDEDLAWALMRSRPGV